jgi:hypothetical protein
MGMQVDIFNEIRFIVRPGAVFPPNPAFLQERGNLTPFF